MIAKYLITCQFIIPLGTNFNKRSLPLLGLLNQIKPIKKRRAFLPRGQSGHELFADEKTLDG